MAKSTYHAIGHTGDWKTRDQIGTSDHLNARRTKKAEIVKVVKEWMKSHPPATGRDPRKGGDVEGWITLSDKRGYRIGTWKDVDGKWKTITSPNPAYRSSCAPRTGKLTAAKEKRIPDKAYGLPKLRKYPMPDASHARNAKARASAEYKRGRLTKRQYEQIQRKANRIIIGCGGDPAPVKNPEKKMKKVRIGARERVMLAVAQNAWDDGQRGSEFWGPDEIRTVRSLVKKRLLTIESERTEKFLDASGRKMQKVNIVKARLTEAGRERRKQNPKPKPIKNDGKGTTYHTTTGWGGSKIEITPAKYAYSTWLVAPSGNRLPISTSMPRTRSSALTQARKFLVSVKRRRTKNPETESKLRGKNPKTKRKAKKKTKRKVRRKSPTRRVTKTMTARSVTVTQNPSNHNRAIAAWMKI